MRQLAPSALTFLTTLAITIGLAGPSWATPGTSSTGVSHHDQDTGYLGDPEAFPKHPLPAVSVPSGVTARPAGQGWLVRIAADRRAQFTLSRHGRPDRLYLDVRGGNVKLPPQPAAWQPKGLAVRLLQLPAASGSAHLILEMDRPMRYEAWPADGGSALMLRLLPPRQRFVLAPDAPRVTIDPGHGGADPGTIGAGGIFEKSVTLALANRVEAKLLEDGLDVQLTRVDDSDVQLRPRVLMGDEFHSDAFVSLHMNHSDNPAIRGIETYYFTAQSRRLAEDIHRHLVADLGEPDRGVRRDDFVVVKYTTVPACLVEVGYLSNHREEALLNSPSFQEKAASAIAAGLQEFLHQDRVTTDDSIPKGRRR